LRRLALDAALAQQGDLYAESAAVCIPAAVQTKWYHPRVLQELGALWRLVNRYRGAEHILAAATFSASLLSVCRERRHWGYVCDNVTPKGSFYKDAIEQYLTLLLKFDAAYREREYAMQGQAQLIRPRVYNMDAGEAIHQLVDRSITMVVTSPPYFGVSDYVKAQRLSLEWMGIDTEPLRRREIGARSKRHRLLAVDEYKSELRELFAAIRTKLKRRGTCVVVIGESARRTPVVDEFVRDMQALGYRIDHTIKRAVSVQRRLAPSVTEESLIIFSLA